MRDNSHLWATSLVLAFLLLGGELAEGAPGKSCLTCHENVASLEKSVHSGLDCETCHDQPADFTEVPHFARYRRVDCAKCHEDAVKTYDESFHGLALAQGRPKAPQCVSCHAPEGDPHDLSPLSKRTAEGACRQCHPTEAQRYDSGVHAAGAAQGKDTPGCVSCHPTHSKARPPSAGAVDRQCQTCHPGAMEDVLVAGHKALEGVLSCASCHDVHGTHKPTVDPKAIEACKSCHPGHDKMFDGSVHEPLFKGGEMSCLSCHRMHQLTSAQESENYGCGACHVQVEEKYRGSVHWLARLHGSKVAASCGDCHGGHHILAVSDPESLMNRAQEPKTCGECHGNTAVITADYVRLPISQPQYLNSIHGKGWSEGKPTAVCTDCHGSHGMESASSSTSSINHKNLVTTCGRCHKAESDKYAESIHGRAVALGIHDSPSCTDCHEEHLILAPSHPQSPVNPQNLVSKACAKCHEDPEMAAKYGLPPDVVSSYKDSYHGWAIKRGGEQVAVCVDCHNSHDIRSLLDPASSIHKNHVVATCGRCHKDSNMRFAQSYNHVLARGRLMSWDYVRIVYTWAIALILLGMVGHNTVIYLFEARRHYRRHRKGSSVRRMRAGDLIQHFILILTFLGLAISGFALRFPDAWWAQILTDAGFNEELRRLFHRLMAVLLILASLFHLGHIALTRRGRRFGWEMLPRLRDMGDAFKTLLYCLGRRKERPEFDMFDYTQKAEYWALIWGTVLMSLTGLVLWFPTVATRWLPAWAVRVCETIHFYEAILAVSAIIIWHLFFTIFRPSVYPMSWTWVDGRMPKEEWEEHHGRAAKAEGTEQGPIESNP